MATNLKAAAEALRQKGPKKKFEVMFEQSETCCITVEAIDEDEARDLAQEEINNGNGNWHSSNLNILNTEEI